ncbi:cyclohexanecarboxylate--CoA ligase [Intrasporangium chromatireducens Q5-1]|uniref:Cyclohexanecarboxylate--CoA ligase n=1 Tax=Intrasporangium chromatireducens Q5-1 TaxID=584657 RepID=W9GTK2_9MICO|nr:AMP-binding protein [Intrasporangium chromatireducens]EWT07209.1 cyclohexanecarboxylate--CoA ligase [Intrasporangium chromatireducens Q5-1]
MSFETILTPDLIEKYTSGGYWQDRTITDYLDDWAERTPEKVAFVDSRREITYAALRTEVDRCALGLRELGIEPGDVVSFQLPNWIEWVVLHYACTRIGAVSNPLIPIYREREVGFMVGLAGSKLVVVPREFRGYDHVSLVESLQHDWDAFEHLLVVGDPEAPGSWETFMATPWEERRDPAELTGLRPDPNDVTLLIFTSGTTGEPKGVMHTHNTAVAANAPLPKRLGVTADSVIHMASTLAHLTGFLYGARLPVQNGATGILQDVWDPKLFADLVERHGITYTSAATPFLHDVVSLPGIGNREMSTLERFCCMGAPIPRAMVRRAKEVLPGMAVLGGWGQTENALVTLGIPGDPEEKIVETDGYPWPGMEIRTVDAVGEAVPAGSEGRLQVRGPFLFVGYAHRMKLTQDSFDGDWFDTGDLAVIDADGYVKISGRTKDIIVRGGENIPVAYVENALYEDPRIEAVAVVGMPDERLQERAAACVVLRPGASLTFEEMQSLLREKGVAKQYWPERLDVLAELPRTPSGKIQKYQLRARFDAAE